MHRHARFGLVSQKARNVTHNIILPTAATLTTSAGKYRLILTACDRYEDM